MANMDSKLLCASYLGNHILCMLYYFNTTVHTKILLQFKIWEGVMLNMTVIIRNGIGDQSSNPKCSC